MPRIPTGEDGQAPQTHRVSQILPGRRRSHDRNSQRRTGRRRHNTRQDGFDSAVAHLACANPRRRARRAHSTTPIWHLSRRRICARKPPKRSSHLPALGKRRNPTSKTQRHRKGRSPKDPQMRRSRPRSAGEPGNHHKGAPHGCEARDPAPQR